MVKEALKPMSNIFVENVSTEFVNSGENLRLNVIISINNKREEVEVVF